MAELCSLSRSRFYDLMNSGFFPKSIQHSNSTSKRPIFDRKLIEKCLEIKRSGIGNNGEPIAFNRKLKKGSSTPAKRKSSPEHSEFSEIASALEGLGMSMDTKAVANAVAELFPTGGWKSADQGDVIKKVFLHVQSMTC